jgi:1-acyl-sn-glycerol-3-phosphate acyltransferase
LGGRAVRHRAVAKGAVVARSERDGFWVKFAVSVFYPAAALLARRVNRGTEHLPAQGGALMVMNHVSHLDPLYDPVLIHKLGRMPHVLAKHSLWKGRFLRAVLDGTGQIPVYRGTTDARDSLRAANQVLRDGKVVLIYPEATITRDPQGWPMYSRTGAARMALDNPDIPVIPAARWGTLAILDLYGKKFRPFPRGTVTTLVGEPIDLSAYRGVEATPAVLREVTDLIMRRVTALLAEIRGDAPPTGFFRPAAAPKEPEAPSGETGTTPDAPADAPEKG